MDCSKSNKLLAIASTPDRLVPNRAAFAAASARASGLDPKDTFIELLTLATSLKTPFKLIPTPAWLAIAAAVATVSERTFSVSSPCILAIMVREDAASPAI